jgi:porphyrinogen peroxidase
MQAAEPQSVLTPLTEAAIFLVLTVDSGSEDEVRSLLADVSGLKRSVGGLAGTVGSAVQMRADQ